MKYMDWLSAIGMISRTKAAETSHMYVACNQILEDELQLSLRHSDPFHEFQILRTQGP
jgi:hypothetical protein